MDNEYIRNLWGKIVFELESKTIEIKTKRLNTTKGLWFSINTENDAIIISESKTNKPSSILIYNRIIHKNDFIKLYPYYQKWKNGDISRESIRKISRNTSYIFAIINYFEETQLVPDNFVQTRNSLTALKGII